MITSQASWRKMQKTVTLSTLPTVLEHCYPKGIYILLLPANVLTVLDLRLMRPSQTLGF